MTKKVLVADDSKTLRRRVGIVLEPTGLSLVEACDGLEALEKLALESDVAIIICDVVMPRMTGMQLVRFLRQTTAYARVPVVMLTATASKRDLDTAKAMGVNIWMMKPFTDELLVDAVTKLLAA